MSFVSDSNLNDNEESNGAASGSAQPGQTSGQSQQVSGSTGNQNSISNSDSATQAPQAPTLASGSGIAGSGGQSTSKAPSYNASAPTSSGQWTNLQNYLDANNGGGFGQEFAGNVGKGVTQAQTDLNNAASTFQNSVNQGTVKQNENVLNEATTSPQTMSSDDQAAFQKQLNGSYSGPQSASSDAAFNQAGSEAKNAFDESQLATTQNGQNVLLQKYYNRPTYSTGEKNLDSAILSSDPESQSALQSLATQGSLLPVSVRNAVNQANTAASGGAATSAQTAAAAQTALNTGLSNVDTAVRNTFNSDVANQPAEYQAELAQIAKGTLPSYLFSQLGTPQDFYQNYGVDATPFLSQALAPSIENTVTPEQAAQIQALERLGTGHIDNPTKYDYATSQTAGSYNPNENAVFNVPGFTTAVGVAQGKYADALAGARQANEANMNRIQGQINSFNTLKGTIPYSLWSTDDRAYLSGLQNQLAQQTASYNSGLTTLADQYGGIAAHYTKGPS